MMPNMSSKSLIVLCREAHDQEREQQLKLAQDRVRFLLGIKDEADPEALAQIEKARLGFLPRLGARLTLAQYALGTARSLPEYCSQAGVDFRSAALAERAKLGGLSRGHFLADRLADALALVASMANDSTRQ